jgi:hypothetical protein
MTDTTTTTEPEVITTLGEPATPAAVTAAAPAVVVRPWNDVSAKLTGAGIAGAVVVVLLYVLNRIGWPVDLELQGALTLLVTLAVGYLIPDRRSQ